MRSQFQQDLDDSLVSFVDADVERRLTPFIPGVDIGAAIRAAADKQVDDGRLVTEGGVVNSAVAVFVFDLEIAIISGGEENGTRTGHKFR